MVDLAKFKNVIFLFSTPARHLCIKRSCVYMAMSCYFYIISYENCASIIAGLHAVRPRRRHRAMSVTRLTPNEGVVKRFE